MSDELAPRKLTPEEQEAVRRSLLELRKADPSLSWNVISKESGIPTGTLATFANGSYGANASGPAEKVQRWMETRGTRKALETTAKRADGFIMTPTAGDIITLLQHAQHLPDIVTITSEPGLGKTSALCHYTRTSSNVFKIVADPTLKSVAAVLRRLAKALGMTNVNSWGHDRLADAIMGKLRGARALIIVDEAQHLSIEQIDMLRTYHDQADAGLALAGNDAVVGKMRGNGTSANHAQLSSRWGGRMKRDKPMAGDAAALLDAWGVEGDDVRKLLVATSLKAGGLRNMNKCHRMATMLANNQGGEITPEIVQLAWRQIGASAETAR